jgi:hypothetical protein
MSPQRFRPPIALESLDPLWPRLACGGPIVATDGEGIEQVRDAQDRIDLTLACCGFSASKGRTPRALLAARTQEAMK